MHDWRRGRAACRIHAGAATRELLLAARFALVAARVFPLQHAAASRGRGGFG